MSFLSTVVSKISLYHQVQELQTLPMIVYTAVAVVPFIQRLQKVTRGVKKMCQVRLRLRRGLVWARNRCPGRDTQVACCRWTLPVVREVPGSIPRGNPPFWPLHFRGDSLETRRMACPVRVNTWSSRATACSSCNSLPQLFLLIHIFNFVSRGNNQITNYAEFNSLL